ncbi:MAG TPA: sulfotransferase, partial [Verrucomicrobiae bacterium]|nr:sulfotransferase [Verrucomicrobiae bacterium]
EMEMTAWLRARDRELALEVDSAALNYWILDLLLREFPDARFVLTIRDCYSWLNSQLNQWLRFPDADERWSKIRQLRLTSTANDYEPGEEVLKEKNFHSLDAHFAHWTTHNARVLATVPSARLLVVRTDEIGRRAIEIADFARLPRRCICSQQTHEFQNPQKQDIIRKIDRGLLERKVEQHCRPLMAQFFPEIKSLADAKL